MENKTFLPEEENLEEQGVFLPEEDEILEAANNIVNNERILLWRKISEKGFGKNWSKYFDSLKYPSRAFKRFIKERFDELLEDIDWNDDLMQRIELKEQVITTEDKEAARVNGMSIIIDFYNILNDIFINQKYIKKPFEWIKDNILPELKDLEGVVITDKVRKLIIKLQEMTEPNVLFIYTVNIKSLNKG